VVDLRRRNGEGGKRSLPFSLLSSPIFTDPNLGAPLELISFCPSFFEGKNQLRRGISVIPFAKRRARPITLPRLRARRQPAARQGPGVRIEGGGGGKGGKRKKKRKFSFLLKTKSNHRMARHRSDEQRGGKKEKGRKEKQGKKKDPSSPLRREKRKKKKREQLLLFSLPLLFILNSIH